MPINSAYTKMVHKTASYTLAVSDDQANFTIAAPATATLPFSRNCSIYSGQNKKILVNNGASTLTIAVQSGDTLVGATAAAATTLAAGQTAFAEGDGVLKWYITGGSGVTGVSGYSGTTGYSGFTGISGYSGYSGKSGFSGYSGFSGKSGYSGFSGQSGFSGFSGKSGYSGFTGISGFSGFTGF